MNTHTDKQEGRSGRFEGADPDLDLLHEAQGGDSKAYEELVLRHQRRVFNVAYRVLGNYDDALDISQDAFIQAYRSLGGFRRESSFFHWLVTITVNLCRNRIKYWKRRARNRTSSLDDPIRLEDSNIKREVPDPSPSALDRVSSGQMEGIIKEEMMSLDEEYRTVLVLREIEEMTYDEIGTVLNIAGGTVKSRLHRGRSLLKNRLRERLSPGSEE